MIHEILSIKFLLLCTPLFIAVLLTIGVHRLNRKK